VTAFCRLDPIIYESFQKLPLCSRKKAALAVERQKTIRELLEREGVVRNAELKAILQVSTVTIRADLRELENAGICEVIWGGALYRQPIVEAEPLLLTRRSKLNVEEKQRIGVRAAQLVESGQTIIVDAGSTTVAHGASPATGYRESLRVETLALITSRQRAVQFPAVLNSHDRRRPSAT